MFGQVGQVGRVGLLGLLGLSAGCESPEAIRTRGGGPGADAQNRPAVVKMHEGSDPFWRTPTMLDEQQTALDAARHAQTQSVQP